MHRLRKLILGVAAGATLAQAGFDPCKFNFGQSWDGPSASYAAQADYITIWVGDGGGQSNYNSYWEGDMLKKCKAGSGHAIAGKTPVFYSYIIAFLAKNKGGLKDCDVAGTGSSQSLCVSGTNFIRNNRAQILQKYDEFAAGAARDYGTSSPIIWLLEPDFHQYAEATSYWGTQSNPLSYAEAATLMTDIVAKIKNNLPNAKISFDISPWIGGSDWVKSQTEWWKAMPNSNFSYRNTSGGRTQGDQARIRSDNNNLTTWAGINAISKLAIIADDGYGVGGASNSDWYEWMTLSNLNSRIADGVVALSIQKPASDYNDKIAALRANSSLSKPNCSGGGGNTIASQFTLTTSTNTGGTIALTPQADAYDSGKVVTAVATAATGYSFTGWGGVCSGTGACSVTMNADKTLTATFASIPSYALVVTKNGNGTGSVTSTPSGVNCGIGCRGNFVNNTNVTLNPTPASGSVFAGWSGACTGTGACTITMNAAKNVTATFNSTTGIRERMPTGQRLSMALGRDLFFDPSNLGHSRLELFGTNGKSIVLWEGLSGGAQQTSLQGMMPGLYIARLRGESETFQQMIQIVR